MLTLINDSQFVKRLYLKHISNQLFILITIIKFNYNLLHPTTVATLIPIKKTLHKATKFLINYLPFGIKGTKNPSKINIINIK